MRRETVELNGFTPAEWPTVTIVFLVFNRRDELRVSLQKMLTESDYPRDRVDVIVVDNASTDGSGEMVREEFPDVRVIVRDRNIGVSGWNDGFAVAGGDLVLALDDDCYLPPDGLRRAVAAALAHEADLVSFKVVSTFDPDHVFTEEYRTGLFMYWGCSVLMRRRVLEALGGYDPEIFVWANELEFTMRFFDRGFRHLHLPEVVAQHMKDVSAISDESGLRAYAFNARHWAYIAAKLFTPRDAVEAFVALLVRVLRDVVRTDKRVVKAISPTFRGALNGLRHRKPLSNPEVSHFYRRNFETYASPWWVSRPPSELLRALPGELLRGDVKYLYRSAEEKPGRIGQYFDERAQFYPERAATLEF